MAFLVLMKINHPRRRSRAPFIRGAVAFGAIDAYTYAFIFFIERFRTMQIAANKAVSIDYTLTNDAGDVIDSSAGGAPLVYLHGAGNIIVGLRRPWKARTSVTN